MKHLSLKLLADTVVSRRKAMKLSQTALSEKTSINRSILSRLESCDYTPSVDQLLSLSSVLGFQPSDVIVEDEAEPAAVERKKIRIRNIGLWSFKDDILNILNATVLVPQTVADKITVNLQFFKCGSNGAYPVFTNGR